MAPPSLVVQVALVAAGGAAGSASRFLIGLGATGFGSRIPAGTLIVNTLGCLLAGVFLFAIDERGQPSPHFRLLLATGFLGGMTTFSAFGFETVQLFQRGQASAALLNIAANVGLSLGAVFLGFAAARAVA